MKLKSGDTVKILSGKDRGKRAKIIRTLPKEFRVVVEGINLKKRHRRSRREDKKGEIVLIPASVPLGQVQLVCPACGKPNRPMWKMENGAKVRVCRKCSKPL